MELVKFEEGTLNIDAAVIGRGLNIEPSLVQVRMREGKITVLSERGVDEDAGRYRLNFFYENRRFRLVVDEEGNATSYFNAQILSMTLLLVSEQSARPNLRHA